GLEQVRVFEKGVSTVAEEPLNYGEFRFEIRDGDIISPRIKPTEPLKNQCRHFLECVRRGKRPISSGIEGCDVVRVLEAVNRSIEYKDRKSTRLNSSHDQISYAVFCLKKKKKNNIKIIKRSMTNDIN